MANSRIYFKSEAGGTTVLSRDTTANSGNLVLPAGGNVASVDTAVTDNAIARYDSTTGKLQNSGVIIDDNNTLFSGVVYSGGTSRGNGSIGVKRSSDNLTVGSFTADDTNSKLSIATAYSNITFSDYAGDRLSIVGGNVGIGVTPSPWHTNISAIDFGYDGNIYARKSGDGVFIGSNYYSNNADGITSIYKNSFYASAYRQGEGTHRWYTAPSGTAGNTISWTNAMTLEASGNLLVGTSTDNGVNKLQVNGSIAVLNRIDTISESDTTPQVTKEFTRTFENSGGGAILNSAFGDVPTCGELYVQELGTDKYLNATFYKGGTSYAAYVTVLASYGLTIGPQNAGGTQVINGATNNANVRMMSKIRKIYT